MAAAVAAFRRMSVKRDTEGSKGENNARKLPEQRAASAIATSRAAQVNVQTANGASGRKSFVRAS